MAEAVAGLCPDCAEVARTIKAHRETINSRDLRRIGRHSRIRNAQESAAVIFEVLPVALRSTKTNRVRSAPTEAAVGVLRRQGLQPDSPCCFCPIVTNMAEYATASRSAEMVTPKIRLAGGEAPLLCRQHGIPQGPARADARRSTGRSPQRVIGTTPLFGMRNIVHGGLLAPIK